MDRHRNGRTLTALGLIALAILAGAAPAVAHGTGAVSYTHLTLPTIYSV